MSCVDWGAADEDEEVELDEAVDAAGLGVETALVALVEAGEAVSAKKCESFQ